MQADDLRFSDFGIDVPPGARGDHKAFCPKCHPGRSDKHDRSLSVNVDRGEWHCHYPKCGWSSGLVKEGRARGMVDEARQPWAPPVPKPRAAWRPPESSDEIALPPPAGPGALAWFEARGIDAETVARFDVRAQARNGAGEVWLPYVAGGKVVNAKRRSTEGKQFSQLPGRAKYLYNLDAIADLEPAEAIVVVEGELDVLAAAQAGIYNVVSPPDGACPPGAGPENGKLEAFSEPTAEAAFARAEQIILATDDDEPGRATADALVERFGRHRCRRVSWPAGCKDFNDVLLRHSAGHIWQMVEQARPEPLPGIITVDDLWPDAYELVTTGVQRGSSTGFHNLDPYYTPKPGYLTVVTGIPSHGKSNFLDHLMVNFADRHGWRFGICSPEHQPTERHVATLAGIANDAPVLAERDRAAAGHRLERGRRWLGDHFYWLDPQEPHIDLILERATAIKRRYGITGLVIDPWSEIETSRERGRSETDHIADTLRKVRRWARAEVVHVWFVAHPTKLPKEDGRYRVPSLYDISGSAHWANMCDLAFAVWRNVDDTTQPVEVHVLKSKFPEQGRTGVAYFAYDRDRQSYRPADESPAMIGTRSIAALKAPRFEPRAFGVIGDGIPFAENGNGRHDDNPF